MKRFLTLVFTLGLFGYGPLASEVGAQLDGLGGSCATRHYASVACSPGSCGGIPIASIASSEIYYSTPQPLSMQYGSDVRSEPQYVSDFDNSPAVYAEPDFNVPVATYSSAPVSNAAAPAALIVETDPSMTFTSGRSSSGLADQKAAQAAQLGLRGHVGGGLGGARYEGVGWSNVSPQHAIQNCCYWGTRPTQQIGVRRGSDGSWYACVLYQ